jgi:hypothetical protein
MYDIVEACLLQVDSEKVKRQHSMARTFQDQISRQNEFLTYIQPLYRLEADITLLNQDESGERAVCPLSRHAVFPDGEGEQVSVVLRRGHLENAHDGCRYNSINGLMHHECVINTTKSPKNVETCFECFKTDAEIICVGITCRPLHEDASFVRQTHRLYYMHILPRGSVFYIL